MTAMLNWCRVLVRYRPEITNDMRVYVPTLIPWGVKDIVLSRRRAAPTGRLFFFDSVR
jgi:head-tail adaptor